MVRGKDSDATMSEQLAQIEGANETAVAPRDRLKDMTERYKREVAVALPDGWSAERFLRILQTECRKNPRLMEAEPVTLLAGMMQLAQLGLTPGINGYLVPFRNHGHLEVQVIIGYKGTVDLVRRSGQVSKLTTGVVRDGDTFAIELGSEPRVVHKPLLESTEGRQATHFYAIAWFQNTGEWDVEVMDRAQTDKVRARSKAADSGPWSTDYEEMARKTVLLRLAKRLPMSDEDRRALSVDGAVKRSIDSQMLDVPDSSEQADILAEEVVDVEEPETDEGPIVWPGEELPLDESN